MFETFFEILILSFVQGISEFIPVSSSAHLFLISEIYQFKSKFLLVDIGLHLGSLLAIVFYFRNDLLNILNNKNLLTLMFVGSLPIIIIGYIIYETGLISHLRNIEVISWTTLVFAIALYLVDKFKVKKKFETDLNLKSILVIGSLQIFALIPGVSRSGITITLGRFLGFNRYDSAKISFFLSIPTLFAASILGMYNIYKEGSPELNFLAIISIIFSFIFSYLTISFFLKFIRTSSLNIFVIYRLIFSLFILAVVYL